MEKFIVSARKYRPNNFSTLIGQDSIALTLKNSIKRGQLASAYLFCGPRGVGKTSTARIFAKTINCLNPSEDLEPCGECESCKSFASGMSYCIHELDAASNNSVDDIRSLIEQVRIPPQIGKYSVYIIDEVHMLSSSAFNAFLKTLEEPPAYAIFILATTEKHKILPTVLSRCQTYDFNRITIADIVKQLKYIADKEGVIANDESLHIIAQKADGAMRDALTLFDQAVAFCGNTLNYESIIKNLNVLNSEYYFDLTEKFLNKDYAGALVTFDEILSKGFNILYFVSELSTHLRNLLVCKENISMKLLETSPAMIEKYKIQSDKCSFKFLYSALAESVKCEADYKTSSNSRLLVEFMLVKISQLTDNGAIANNNKVDIKNDIPAQIDKSPEVKQVALQPEPKAQKAKNAVNTLSIKSIINNLDSNNIEKSNIDLNNQNEVTINALNEAWKKMAKSQSEFPRLGTAIENVEPILLEDKTTVLFIVGNSAQKEWIEKKSLNTLNDFLQKELSNKNIKITIEVKKVEDIEKKLYMPEEKANFLLKNNTELQELKNDLDLELK